MSNKQRVYPNSRSSVGTKQLAKQPPCPIFPNKRAMAPVHRSMTGAAPPHSRNAVAWNWSGRCSGPHTDPEAPTAEKNGVDVSKGSTKRSLGEAHLQCVGCRRTARPHRAMIGGVGLFLVFALLLYSFHDVKFRKEIEQGSRSYATNGNSTLVEFSVPGLYIPISMALDVRLPVLEEEERLSPPSRRAETKDDAVSRNMLQAQHGVVTPASPTFGASEVKIHPLNGIRLLVAVTSACCSDISLARREEIRNTWAKLTKERYPSGVDIVFFLTQPESAKTYTKWLPVLEEEVRRHGDIIVLRGKDTYMNLPNKTFRMLRYALAHPNEYSHVLKTDDDTWVRVHRLIQVLHEIEPLRESKNTQLSKKKEDEKNSKSMEQLKTQLAEMSQSRGTLITSDGIALYDAAPVLKKADKGIDGYSLNTTIDDVDGTSVTLNTLSSRAFQTELKAKDVVGDAKGGETPPTTKRILLASNPIETPPLMKGVYLGCVEVKAGFQPIRNPSSKWYISNVELPDDEVPWGVQYLAGWGYVLSRDLVRHVVQKVDAYEADPESAPMWYKKLHWEDVLVGALVEDATQPRSHVAFRPAWRSCHVETAVRHLDIDSPRLLTGLVAQDASGLSDEKAVQCSSGQFLPGDYNGWFEWRSSLNSQH